MLIERLELTGFRSYRRFTLEPAKGLTVLVGENAVGKTNVIEAIEMIATGRSFRNPLWAETVGWGEDHATIAMVAADEFGQRAVDLTIGCDGRRQWRVDGAVKRRTGDATRFLPAVVFTPDDLALAKGPAEGRRLAVDLLGDQLSATYGVLRREYARIVRHRNAALKERLGGALTGALEEQLVTTGARLHVHRRRLVGRIGTAAAGIYGTVSNGERLSLEIRDRCGVDARDPREGIDNRSVEDCLRAELERRRKDEGERQVTLVGPHRDDLVFMIDGRDARTFASQGQQRTLALAWKLAEVRVIQDVLDKTPVLLLDDVMSELDGRRRQALTELVNQDVQTFVTTTNAGYFDRRLLETATVVQITKEPA